MNAAKPLYPPPITYSSISCKTANSRSSGAVEPLFRRILITLITVLFIAAPALSRSHADTIVVRYHQGSAEIDPDILGNKKALDSLCNRLKALAAKLNAGKVSLTIDAYSSPEGLTSANRQLSDRRAQSMREYICSRFTVPNSILSIRSHGVDWVGLDSLVTESHMQHKEEILRVLRTTPEWIFDDSLRVVDGRKRRLGMLHGGRPYRHMLLNMFPALRRSCVTIIIDETDLGASIPGDSRQDDTILPTVQTAPATDSLTTASRHEDQPLPNNRTTEAIPESPQFCPVFAVKTNLLEWAGIMPDFRRYTFVPNLEVEWFFARRWSLSGKGSYVKRSYGSDKFFGISAWSLEPRFWLRGNGRFSRLYAGLYAQIGDYDVQDPSRGIAGDTGRLFSSGLSLGAAIPLTRHLGFDIGLRAGYRHSTVRSYNPVDDYLLNSSSHCRWGITGINVSLYWRFGKTIK